jgi:hypothetical protein
LGKNRRFAIDHRLNFDRSGQPFEHLPWLGYYAKFIPSLGETTKLFRALCMSRGSERMQRSSTVKDLFYYMVCFYACPNTLPSSFGFQSNEDGAEKQTPPKPVVMSDSGLAIIAGSDTTANAISNILYSLLTHPETYERLQAEIDQYYPPDEDSLNTTHHPTMVYLDAVMYVGC